MTTHDPERRTDRHPLLGRQLRRLCLVSPVPDATSFEQFLERVDATYRDDDHARALLERSLAISARELRELTLDMERSSESLLAHERDRLRLLFDSVTTGLLVIDRFGRITSVNPEAERLLGAATDLVDSYIDSALQMVGRDGEPRPLVGRDELDRALRAGRWVRNDVQLVDARQPFKNVEPIDGGVPSGLIAADVAIVAFRAGDAHLGGLVVVTDNAVREEARSKLAWQATHDALTGLPNRTLLAERIEVALVQSRRTSRWPSVLFIDLDRFKHVNDSLGHAAGDRLLVAAADRLQRSVRRGDTVARTGGDEFVVLCDGPVDAGAVRHLADRILLAMSESFDLAGEQAFVSASIGITHAGPDDVDADVLLRGADLAMYRAKALGGGRIDEADDRLRSATAEGVQLERVLRSAVHSNEISVEYLPVFRVESGELVGFEALALWMHPSRGLVPPKEFQAVAEGSGLILAIGDRVLDVACENLSVWNCERRRLGGAPLMLQINVSGRELASPSLVGRITDALSRHELTPNDICLDLSEDVLLDQLDIAERRLQELHEAGISMAIDNFGSGHMCIASLRRFPVGMVKIDRGLVAGIDRSPRDERVVRAVVDLAHALGCQVLSEGVETPRELSTLRALGCDFVHGELFGGAVSGMEAALMSIAHHEASQQLPIAASGDVSGMHLGDRFDGWGNRFDGRGDRFSGRGDRRDNVVQLRPRVDPSPGPQGAPST